MVKSVESDYPVILSLSCNGLTEIINVLNNNPIIKDISVKLSSNNAIIYRYLTS
jgi:hypothetical protein